MDIDLSSFKAPFYKYDKIRQITKNLLAQYGKDNDIPVDIDHLVEFDLGIDIIPVHSLKPAYQVDSWLSNDVWLLPRACIPFPDNKARVK